MDDHVLAQLGEVLLGMRCQSCVQDQRTCGVGSRELPRGCDVRTEGCVTEHHRIDRLLRFWAVVNDLVTGEICIGIDAARSAPSA